MEITPTERTIQRGLIGSILSGIFNSVYVQLVIFGPVLVIYLNELGMSKTQIGFILSLFPFAGILALFIYSLAERFGYKRTYLIFYGTRKAASALLLLAPVILLRFGLPAAFAFVVVVLLVFAICRAIAETAYNPWSVEFIPNGVRGKYQGIVNVTSTLASLAALSFAGLMLGRMTTGYSRFQIVMGVGVLFGFLSVASAAYIPGGAPQRRPAPSGRRFSEFGQVLRDTRFARYLGVIALLTLSAAPLSSFLPLFMQGQLGLSAPQVVWVQNGNLIGALLFSYLWGWLSDRFGSRPVMLAGLYVRLALPLCWLLLPRQSGGILPALLISFLDGVSGMGWSIGAGRLLFVSIVPREKRAEYLSFYYAWSGVLGGLSPLIAGFLLDTFAKLNILWLGLRVDAFFLLFGISFLTMLAGVLLATRIRSEDSGTVREMLRHSAQALHRRLNTRDH